MNRSSKATVAQLLDLGNLVLKNEGDTNSDQNYLWQNFDHPMDTLLQGKKLGWDFRIGLNRYLTSWKSADDPSPGEFSHGIDPGSCPQMVLRSGSIKQYRAGLYDLIQT
ncbi:hypothetical protein ACH5RR_017749 [Cinchona calisaya]|uniref:Bulb-type lectin domain-containing protein n=1 Tax=Cinchona calisaya TaxID=153742 RepID=A0ABD2ZN41_9GENT